MGINIILRLEAIALEMTYYCISKVEKCSTLYYLLFIYLVSWTSKQVSSKIYFFDSTIFYKDILMDIYNAFWVVSIFKILLLWLGDF